MHEGGLARQTTRAQLVMDNDDPCHTVYSISTASWILVHKENMISLKGILCETWANIGVSSQPQKVKERLKKLPLCFESLVRSESSVRPVILKQSPEFLGSFGSSHCTEYREVQSNRGYHVLKMCEHAIRKLYYYWIWILGWCRFCRQLPGILRTTGQGRWHWKA